ncbi:hypothetical protein NUU61_002161 [Penicillium alfredii]|uniref:5'-3' DNA helicase ZGRF1-like N-terminal domain-containing protein n=1 Tax=Penicillium alfredii TaxID=1506179 RepID=A0A9W9FR20_9EURO|nr:uncharacterized protein NUU61_002161 [Penicillium alfredii]KAJ5104814.1 hypothetical protein NUU61_002161 [Penicillium alfredii]
MSTPLSSTPRPTGGTPSQATASVVKFRCLYTHDLRRKSKRWQDGYLRYHTFNKRIMVFDEQGNFIGDHHWRSGDEVQDGDELELDKGALIQVCEAMGTTQTDLSNLFEKRKSSQTSPQSNAPGSQPRTSTPLRSSGSSQPFRSLNDLLGIKKTSIGHLVSPYEERHPQAPRPNTQDVPERAPKRQKKSSEGNVRASSDVEPAVVDLTQTKPKAPSRKPKPPSTIPTNETLKSHKNPGLNKPSPREERSKDAPEFVRPQKPEKSTVSKPSMPPAPPASKPTMSRPAPEAPARTVVKDAVKNMAEDARPRKSESAREPSISQPSASRTSSSNPSSDTPTSTLRMAVDKPRKKLIYRALLPDQTSRTPVSAPSIILSNENKSESASTTTQPRAATDPAPDPPSTNADFAPSVSTQFILEEMIDDSGAQPTSTTKTDRHPKYEPGHLNPMAPNLPARRSLDAPLRKSISDPTTLTARPSLQGRPPLTRSSLSTAACPDEPHDQGPWTAEAMDLFNFWPPGRVKPG